MSSALYKCCGKETYKLSLCLLSQIDRRDSAADEHVSVLLWSCYKYVSSSTNIGYTQYTCISINILLAGGFRSVLEDKTKPTQCLVQRCSVWGSDLKESVETTTVKHRKRNTQHSWFGCCGVIWMTGLSVCHIPTQYLLYLSRAGSVQDSDFTHVVSQECFLTNW